ncbi:MAG TPA: hypothetical protein VLB27_02220 [candidate division Zixibacteria bacterium]|nr:hypothetical protein [candidate division Zixibacteria bacterium]
MNEADRQSAEPEVRLEWVSQPMRRSLGKTLLAATSILFAGLAAAWVMDAPGMGLIAMVIMFATLAKFFLPTRYTFTDSGITVKTTTTKFTRPWHQFRSFYVDKNGVLLSPFATPSRLENFRGLYLTFEDNKAEVVAFLKDHVKAPELPEALRDDSGA